MSNPRKYKLKLSVTKQTGDNLKALLDKVCNSGIELNNEDIAIVHWLYEQRSAIRALTDDASFL